MILKKDKVVFNEMRDIILFFPTLFRKDIELIQWVRSEYAGRLLSILLKQVDKVVTVTDVVKDNISSKTTKPIFRIHNFMFKNPIYNIKSLSETKRINIAVIGSIQEIKGQLDAVKTLPYLKSKLEKEVLLHIVGREFDSIYTREIREYIRKNNLSSKVNFLGHVDDVIDYLNKNIHVTLVPSQTESFCRVAMESISVGVPVIAYKVGGLQEVIVHNETGILVEKDDIKSLSNSLSFLVNNNETYVKMSKNARKDWENRFYSESVKKELFGILDFK